MIYFDKDDYQDKDLNETDEPSDFVKKLEGIAKEKELEDAQKVDQPDPTAGYAVGEPKNQVDDDADIIVAPGTAHTLGTGGIVTADPANTPSAVPPVIVDDVDDEEEEDI